MSKLTADSMLKAFGVPEDFAVALAIPDYVPVDRRGMYTVLKYLTTQCFDGKLHVCTSEDEVLLGIRFTNGVRGTFWIDRFSGVACPNCKVN